VVMTSLFALKVIIDVGSGQGCRTIMMMPLQFALTGRIFDFCTSCQKFVSLMHLLFAVTAVMKFIIADIRFCTSDEDSTRIFVIDTWITLGFWVGLLGIVTLLFAFTYVMPPDNASGPDCGTVLVLLLLIAYTAVMRFIIASRVVLVIKSLHECSW
jgi:cytochrome b561